MKLFPGDYSESEMIMGVLEYVRTQREVRGIQGTFANENHRSQRVMEKLGMSYAEDVTVTKPDGSASYPGKRYRRLFPCDRCSAPHIGYPAEEITDRE